MVRAPELPTVTRRLRAIALLAALVGLAGCSGSSIFSNIRNRNAGTATPPTATSDQGAESSDSLVVYLEAMRQLIDGDALSRAAVFNDAEEAAEYAPTKINRLLYALALTVPGHPGSDPEAGAARLRALLAAGETLLPEERLLATIQLRHAEQLVILEASSAELTERIDAAVAENEAVNAERLRNAQNEIARLKKELESATAMLDAITNIERSISESEVQ